MKLGQIGPSRPTIHIWKKIYLFVADLKNKNLKKPNKNLKIIMKKSTIAKIVTCFGHFKSTIPCAHFASTRNAVGRLGFPFLVTCANFNVII
jgi:hypothetical protein